MNQRLTEKLTKLPETLSAATNIEGLTNAVVEVERLVLKSNYEDSQSGAAAEPYEKRDFVVGEANTRGLSWKLNLFRAVADANFCKMVRVGVHGGNVMILGQRSNADTAIQIYETLVPALDRLSGIAFTEFSDGQKTEEGAPTVNRAGWINQWLISAPTDLSAALAESRTKDASSNGKIANMVAEAASDLTMFASTITPSKPVKEPKAPKAPKAPKEKKEKKSTAAPEGNAEMGESTDEESEELEDTPDDGEDAYPGVTYAESDTAEEAQTEASS